MDGVLSYLEFFKDLSLDRLKKNLRSHYGAKNIVELCQSLAFIYKNGKETPQAFLTRAFSLRQTILFTSQEGEDSLKYDAGHIQQLVCRTVETSRMAALELSSLVEDEELTH